MTEEVKPSVEQAWQVVIDATGCSRSEILSKCRDAALVEPRALMAYVLTECCGLTSLAAGEAMDRDHSTILHHRNKLIRHPSPALYGVLMRLGKMVPTCGACGSATGKASTESLRRLQDSLAQTMDAYKQVLGELAR